MRPRSWLRTPAQDVLVEVIKSARERAGITQRELATRLATEQSMIGRIETGQRAVTVLEFIEICRAVGVDPREAFSDVLDRVPAKIDV